jgi:antitoxin HicB
MDNATTFAYPYDLAEAGGEWVLTFPDLPGAITGGATRAEARALARDAMVAALGGCMETRDDIPPPSAPAKGQEVAYLDPLEAAKVALYIAMRGAGLTNVGLAAKLRMDEKAVRRMLDLDQRTRIDAIHDALRGVFGVRLVTAMCLAGGSGLAHGGAHEG